MWNLVKRLLPASDRVAVRPVVKSNGAMASSEEEIVEAWAEHQERLGTPKDDPLWDAEFAKRVEDRLRELSEPDPDDEVKDATDPLSADFSGEEIRDACDALDYHKAGTEDGTRNPMYRCAGEEMMKQLGVLFNFLKSTESIPAGWSWATIINLFKEGDQCDPNNYRGIALISCLGKLYLSLWARRITKHLESKITENQGGFRPRRNTVDQTLILKETLLRRRKEGLPTYVYFVDFRKAFDTVWRDGLWVRLWEMGVKGKSWRIIKALYSNVSCSVRVGDRLTRRVRLRQGVRQGCPLSPVLFNCFIDELSVRLRKAGYGVSLGVDRDLHSLLYADDVAVLADSPEALQRLIQVVDDYCRQWRMDINLTKSKAMVVGKRECACVCGSVSGSCSCSCSCESHLQGWTCRDKEVEVVEEYKYLGLWFNSRLQWGDHINKTVKKASGRSTSLRRLLTNGRVIPRAKLLVWFSYVRPLLDYGCEVWKPDSAQARRLESIQTQAGSLIFKLNVKTHLRAVRALMKCTSLDTRRSGFRLRYLAKLFSYDESRLARYAAFLPAVKNKIKGRSSKLWFSELEALIKGDSELRGAYSELIREVNRNGGVLPQEATVLGPEGEQWEYHPLADFNKRVDKWMWSREKTGLVEAGRQARSTLRLLARSLEGADWPYKIRMSRFPNQGPNQIRLRLLSGTSALNETLSKFRDRDPSCPWPECKELEDAAHFLLRCPEYDALRKEYLAELKRNAAAAATPRAVSTSLV